jgi:AcrR family transcriptional regulator
MMTSSAARDVRAEILVEATGLFVAHGYHGLSMRQIAEAVGVTKAALYYHFENKEALFLAILGSYLERVEEMILQVQAEGNTCRQRIRLLVQRILRQPAEQRAVIRLASQEIIQVSAPARQAFRITYHERFIGVIQAILEAGIASGELRPVDPYLATWTLLGMIHPYLYPVGSDDAELSDDAIEQMVTIYLDGLTMPRE